MMESWCDGELLRAGCDRELGVVESWCDGELGVMKSY